MGIDAAAIFDCRLSREEMLDLAVELESHNAEFSRMFPYEKSQGRPWKIDIDDEDGEVIEISGGWPFGVWRENDGLLCLWNISRWKFILQHDKSHYAEFFASARLVAEIAGAGRMLCLSDYTLARIDTSIPFAEILKALGKPFDRAAVHDIVEGYQAIFFYEQLE